MVPYNSTANFDSTIANINTNPSISPASTANFAVNNFNTVTATNYYRLTGFSIFLYLATTRSITVKEASTEPISHPNIISSPISLWAKATVPSNGISNSRILMKGRIALPIIPTGCSTESGDGTTHSVTCLYSHFSGSMSIMSMRTRFRNQEPAHSICTSKAIRYGRQIYTWALTSLHHRALQNSMQISPMFTAAGHLERNCTPVSLILAMNFPSMASNIPVMALLEASMLSPVLATG